MATFFENGIRSLNDLGVFDVIIPFILVFTIVYAIMLKTKILGDKKQFNVMIAFVLALSVIIPHVLGTYPPNLDVVDIINSVLPQVSMILVAILALLLMIGIWGQELDIAGSNVGGWIVILSAITVFVLFGVAANWFELPRMFNFLDDPEVLSLVIVILVFGIIIWFITREESDSKEDRKGIVDNFTRLLGGKGKH